MDRGSQRMLRVSFVERQLNRLVGVLASRGLGPAYTYRLEVEGRRSGKCYSTPVNLMRRNGRPYLVAPRGWTQWVKNAITTGRVRLVRGRSVQEFAVRLVPEGERPPDPQGLPRTLPRRRPALLRRESGSAGRCVRATGRGLPGARAGARGRVEGRRRGAQLTL